MSAWVVSKKHVDLMVVAAVEGTRDGVVSPSKGYPDLLGQMLVSECVASVSYRYPNDDVSKGELPGPCDPYYLKPYTFEHPKYRPTAGELAQAVACYEYQSCEHPGWKESSAKRFCDGLMLTIRTRVADARKEYESRRGSDHLRFTWKQRDAAPWSFDAFDIGLCFARSHPDGRALLAAVQNHPGDGTPVGALSDWLTEQDMIEEPLPAGWFDYRSPLAAV